MIKILGLTTIAMSTLLLTGCGGGDSKSTTEKIKEKDIIFIYNDVYNGNCQRKADEIKRLGEEFHEGGFQIKDITVDTREKDVNCATYGRSNNGTTCSESYIGQGTETCVVAFNVSQNKNLKQMENEEVSDLSEMISYELL